MDTLRAAGADSALIDLVAALHAESTYSFRAQGQEGQVVSTTGIKQGCKLAPTLFSMLTGTIFRELIALVGVQAVVDYLTARTCQNVSMQTFVGITRNVAISCAMKKQV